MSLPNGFIRELNALGFALVDGEQAYSFVRVSPAGELRVLVEPLGSARWSVGLTMRAAQQKGRPRDPEVVVPLGRVGGSIDGIVLDVSTSDLCDNVPHVLRDSVLPMWDVAPT
jgi:hypothetical protein